MLVTLAHAAEPPAPVREAAGALTPGSATTVPGVMTPGKPPPSTGAPTVQQIAPAELKAGQSYPLSLSGSNFRAGMQVDLGPGIVIAPAITITDAGHASVTVQVLASAAPGRRVVTTTLPQALAAAPTGTLKTQGPGFVDVIAPSTAGPVLLERVLPASVAQGQSVTLSLRGSGFAQGMAVSFGPGITAPGAVRVMSPESASVAIQVAPQAPPILRHPTLVVSNRETKVLPDATLTVVAANGGLPAPGSVAGLDIPVVLTVSPSRVFTGEKVTLTVRGQNLVPQLQIDLGAGIGVVGGLRVQSPSLATLDVAVAGDAAPGMRWLGMQIGVGTAPIREDASLLVQRSPVLRPGGVAPKPPPCTEPKPPLQGSIVIDGPTFTGSGSDVGSTYNVPVLNDQTNFVWHEANPGLADYYEIRFYSGSTLIATRKITRSAAQLALPHNLRPDAALINELTTKVGARAPKLVNYHSPPSPAVAAVSYDIAWQVAGLKTFYDSCTSPAAVVGQGRMLVARERLGNGKDIQVEHSEAVPVKQPSTGDPLLDLPAAPTGLACGGNAPPPYRMRAAPGSGGPAPPALGQTSLSLVNETRASTSQNRVETADYVYDEFRLKGTIDLSNSPWAMQSQRTVGQPNSAHPVESETVDNVYIDWGDGSVEPLTVQWQGQSCGGQPCFASNTETSSASLFDLQGATNPGAFGHQYRSAGPFTARVYMLPAGAVQAHGILPMSLRTGGGGTYGQLLHALSPATLGEPTAEAEGYLLYCKPLVIQHRTDPATNGPLQLVDIKITGFPDSAPAPGGVRLAAHGARLGAAGAPAPATAPSPAPTARPGLVQRGGLPAGPGAVPQFSSCDRELVGGATLDYVGEGTARFSWYRDGVPVGSSDEPIDSSTARSDQQLAPPKPAAPIVTPWPGIKSPALDLSQSQLGVHELIVRADVVADAHPTGRALQAIGALGALGARPGALVAAATTAGPPSGPVVGVLGPRTAASAGLPPILWVNRAPAGAPGVGLNLGVSEHHLAGPGLAEPKPPESVVSAPARYETTAADPSLPCTFNFPVNGGSFVIAGLQRGGKATITAQGGKISGSGTLDASFVHPSGTGTQSQPVSIQFQNWTLAADGVTVESGSFDQALASLPLPLPALKAKLTHIAGAAGSNVTATLDATLANDNVKALDSTVPAWRGVAAPLSPQGDWYADQQSLPALLVYDSGFTLKAANATLDFSQSAGSAPDTTACLGAGGAGWTGVRLNGAALTPFNFDLQNAVATPVSGWAIDGAGLCGRASLPAFSGPMERGTIGWSGIAATASGGAFAATYQNLKVHVPWLNVDLGAPSAATQLTAGHGAGVGGINLNLTSPARVTVNLGGVSLSASSLAFTSLPSAGGWTVKSETALTFNSPQGTFASGVTLHGFDYGLDGVGTFADGSHSRHIGLSGQNGTIGGASVDLKSVDVTLGAANAPLRAAFAFDSTLTLSKSLPSADVAVSYEIDEPTAGSYTSSGPATTPFQLDKPFPDANPSVHLHMTPTYTGPPHSGSGILFASNLDLGMFGGPPVAGQFVLGYVGSSDYWLAKAILDLGPTGVTLVPPALNLYQVGGGMGYNVTLDSFKNQDLKNATPSNDGALLFDAALLVGSPDHTTFGLQGDFVIKPGGQDPGGRMDYHAWLLNPDWSGQSPIWGYFAYTGGVFDGTLNAQLSLLDNQIALDALNDAIHMHVGGGQWYFHLGTQQNPISGHVFFVNGQGWADLGSDGFMLGLIARLDLSAGDCGGACAYIHDNWQLGASITPSPLAFSANASQSFSLGACAAGFCVNANASAGVNLGLPPPQLSFNFHIGGCPPGHIDVGLEVLPSLNPNVGGSVCLW